MALAPGGASKPKPGILPLKLDFKWGRDVPTLYLAAENDASLPLSGMLELFDRTPSTKQMLILRRADHMHFMDAAEDAHEAFRTMRSTAEVARIQEEMLPIAELCTGEQAHLFVRGLTLGHMDATLKHMEEAQRFLTAEALENLAARGIDAFVHSP